VRRKREQNGTVFQARGIWYVRYFEDRVENGEIKHVRVAKQLGAVTTRGKRPPKLIEDEAKAIVSAASVTNAAPDRVLTIGDFVDLVYFPHVEQHKRPSTLKGYTTYGTTTSNPVVRTNGSRMCGHSTCSSGLMLSPKKTA
jgi:hypothetical protein